MRKLEERLQKHIDLLVETAVYNFINDRLADKPAVLKPLS